MKFCANISFMFKELPFQERYFAAKELGFRGVESAFPNVPEKEFDSLVQAKNNSGLEQVLLNIYCGDLKDVNNDGFGCAATPGQQTEFAQRLEYTINLAKLLDCSRIHIMSGLMKDGCTRVEQLDCYKKNLFFASNELAKHNIVGVIEPINKYSVPNYFMNNYTDALEVIKEVNSKNLRLLLDVFHCQQIRGNLTRAIDDFFDVVGHVQVAQVPKRGEPDTPGEIEYAYILQQLESKGYDKWIGCEYNPTKGSNTTSWIDNFGFSL